MAVAEPDVLEFRKEARRQMEEVSFALKKWVPHEDGLPTTESALMDLTTLEGRDYTIQLDRTGFRVVEGGDGVVGQVFETVFSLMAAISPGYNRCFNSCLAAKLSRLVTSNKEGPVDRTNETTQH